MRRGITVPAADVDARLTQAARRTAARGSSKRRSAGPVRRVADARREIRRALTIAKAHDVVVTAKCAVSEEEAAAFLQGEPRSLRRTGAAPHLCDHGRRRSEQHRRAVGGCQVPRRTRLCGSIAAGASFEETALKYSTDPSRIQRRRHGIRPSRQPHRRLRAGREGSAGLDGRAASIETLYGYHIIRVSEVRPPQKRTFGEVRVEPAKRPRGEALHGTERCVDGRTARQGRGRLCRADAMIRRSGALACAVALLPAPVARADDRTVARSGPCPETPARPTASRTRTARSGRTTRSGTRPRCSIRASSSSTARALFRTNSLGAGGTRSAGSGRTPG